MDNNVSDDIRRFFDRMSLPDAPSRLVDLAVRNAEAGPRSRGSNAGVFVGLGLVGLLLFGVVAGYAAGERSANNIVRPFVAVANGGSSCIAMDDSIIWKPYDSPISIVRSQVVLVALIVPETDIRSAFPWDDLQSSDVAVLTASQLCGPPFATSLPIKYFAFEAASAGTVSVVGDLSSAWQALPQRSHDIQRIQINVEVK